MNIPISSDKIPELRERIRKFQDEIIGWAQSESMPDRLVQLGTYLIPYPSTEVLIENLYRDERPLCFK